jgi:hypothetical protein
MDIRRRHALFLVTTLTAITLVPVAPAFATAVAPPATVATTVADLPAAADPAAPARAARLEAARPAATAKVATDVAFSTIGVRLPDGVDEVLLRTRSAEDGTWGEWFDAERAGLDGPDAGTADAATGATDLTEPLWVGPSDAFELAYDGDTCEDCASDTDGLAVELIDTLGLNEGVVAKVARHLTPRPVVAPAEAGAGRPAIISRAAWGANESLRKGSPSYRTPTFGVVHHTAGSNNYTKAQSAAVVRGIYSYHTQAQGWSDIGYNVLVDKYGQIFEGRYGGLHRGVVGAHSAGFNSGSFGVSAMGNFDVVDIPSVAVESMARVIAWKYDLHGIPDSPTRTVTVNGKRLNTLTAHRNVGNTSCPGRYLYGRMGQIRSRVAALATGGSSSTTTSTRFTDVPESHNQYAAIEYIAARGITNGCGGGRYCPSDPASREQMASFLTRALDLEQMWWSPFKDVDSSTTHGRNIATIYRAGITKGCAPDRFCPQSLVTRAEMASFMARAFDVPPARSPFPDVNHQSTHADAIGGLAAAGISNGYSDGTYKPAQHVTRAEMALFLNRALVWKAKN